MAKYNPKKVEQKWQRYWEKHPELYAADDKSGKEKKYVLDMFPYPSGDGLHAGHVESYTATDIMARYLRMNNKNVLHPQGWDAFGLPAENYAVKNKIHPSIITKKSIATFKKQMKRLGFSYDWSRELKSSDPNYYKWTQWFFLLLYKNGYAYRAKAKANFCSGCQTVLANEQVIAGRCERCSTKITQKDLEQWFFKITDFIEDIKNLTSENKKDESLITKGLLSGLDKIDWPDSTKAAQRNWIGRSIGAIIKFPIVIPSEAERSNRLDSSTPLRFAQNDNNYLDVFTTRLDTIYGCTYCVVAPEHQLIQNYKPQITNYSDVKKYLIRAQNKTELDRIEQKNKTGVEIKGIKAINPFTSEKVPIFVADYILGHYGTGAVMAVPAHDERDYDFAVRYNLPIRQVVRPGGNQEKHNANLKNRNVSEELKNEKAYIEDGILINSREYNNLPSEKAREEMVKWLEKNKLGSRKVNYKLRDWLVSRQRYWGAPIPIIYCEKCGTVPVPEKDLPVKLPYDVDFKPTGESPLKYFKKFHDVKCPICKNKAQRESDTMDTFVCSSWYFFRYTDPKNRKKFASPTNIKKWLPVDLYLGGAEHTVLHLLYSRFFTKVLHKLGYIDFDEPFLKLRHQGIILGEDGQKMSKSRGNIINPDEVISKYGADALRMFEMFMGPLEDMKPWSTRGIIGIKRFLNKVYNLRLKLKNQKPESQIKTEALLHKTIKKVTEDIESLRFNTAVSSLMVMANKFDEQKEIHTLHYAKYLMLLSPFAPHISEELWSKIGGKESIFKEKWPPYDPALIKEKEINLVIQVNGKVRGSIKIAVEASEDKIKKLAFENANVKKHLEGKKIVKTIYVPGKILNIVAC